MPGTLGDKLHWNIIGRTSLRLQSCIHFPISPTGFNETSFGVDMPRTVLFNVYRTAQFSLQFVGVQSLRSPFGARAEYLKADSCRRAGQSASGRWVIGRPSCQFSLRKTIGFGR